MSDNVTPTRLTMTQFAILDALYVLDRPVTVEELAHHTPVLRRQQLESALLDMARLGLVQHQLVDDAVRFWQITFEGRAQIIIRDTQNIFEPSTEAETKAALAEDEALRNAVASTNATIKPVSATVCDAQEPPAPAIAILHIDEAELNDWWATLDVDEKADVWAGHSLGFFAGNLRPQYKVPVAGTVDGGGVRFTPRSSPTISEWFAKNAPALRKVLNQAYAENEGHE